MFVAIRMRVFTDIPKQPLPKRRKWIMFESLLFVKELSVSSPVHKRVFFWFLNKGQWKKCVFASTVRLREENEFRVSWKLCPNLSLRKLLRRGYRFVRNLIQALLRDGPINFKILFLKTFRLATRRRLEPNLFHSTTVDGKKRVFKTLCLEWNRVILFVFLIL